MSDGHPSERYAEETLRNVLLLVALISAAIPAHAQFAQAELLGSVTSPSGEGLPDIVVTARDQATGLSRSITTLADGSYAISGLNPGRYAVTFARHGLPAMQSTELQLRVGQKLRLNATLEVAPVTETIVVNAKANALDIDSKQVGETITAKDFLLLPSQNRSFVLFAALVPGVIPNPQTISESADAVYINGQHQANNTFRVDGAKDDDPLIGSLGGAQARVALEAIQEFQVVTTQYDAEFGEVTGGVLNVITKSGTNDLRGSAFGYRQRANWNENDFFAKRKDLPRPDASFRSEGFTLGGPVVRDRVHAFVSVERVRDRKGITHVFTSRPDLNFSTTGNSTIRNVFGRIDAELAAKHHASIRYVGETAPQRNKINGATTALEGALEEQDSDSHGSAALESTLAPRATNSARASRTHEHVINAASPFGHFARNAEIMRSLAPLQRRPSVQEGPNTLGSDQVNDSIDLADTVSLLLPGPRGTHEVRSGVQWSRRGFDIASYPNANGRFDFNTDRPFDPNDASTYPIAFTIRIRGSAIAKSSKDDVLGLFVQDDWRASNNVTVSAGLRWDREDIVHDRDNFAPRLGFAWSPGGSGRTVVRGGAGRFYDRTSMSAWSTFLSDSVRLTEGFPVRIPDAGNNRQYFVDVAKTNRITTLVALRDYLAHMLESHSTTLLNVNPTVDNPTRVEPYVDTFTLGAHREFFPGVTAGIDLVRTESRKTLLLVDLNPFSSRAGGRPNLSILDGKTIPLGSITTLVNAGSSRYDAVQLSMRKAMTGRFGARISYTYADSSGTYGNATPLGVLNTAYFQTRTETGYNFDTGQIIGEPLNLNLDDARSAGQPVGWHRRHNFVVAGAWLVPHTAIASSAGLSVSFIYRYMSGDRFTIFTNDLLDNGSRAVAPRGLYDAGTPSDIALNKVGFSGTMFGAENPDFRRLDLSLRYVIPTRYAQAHLMLIGDVYNVTNRRNFLGVGGTIVGSSGFLTPTATFDPREFQIGALVSF